jgi:PAS domain-containing protein
MNKSLWEILWDYDPNGLVVVNLDMTIKLVNQAFCNLVKKDRKDLIGKHAAEILDDVEDFKDVWEKNEIIKAKEKTYPQYDLHVRKVIFPVKDEEIIACIMVDVTHEWKRHMEWEKIQNETIERVHHVVDDQMRVVQQIAGLLGETTAETKVSMLKLVDMLKKQEQYGQ